MIEPIDPPSTDLIAPPPNCDGVGEALDETFPRALLVVVGDDTAEDTTGLSEGSDGKIVAEAGVGNEIVADKALKEDEASALFAA